MPHFEPERARDDDATADDAAYGIFDIEGGIVAQINSSWTVRVHRDELVEFRWTARTDLPWRGCATASSSLRARAPSRCGTPTSQR
jgi:hypothetical protein